MMKKNALNILLVIALLFVTKVYAVNPDNLYSPDEIPDSSYVIGTYLFTSEENDIYDTTNEETAIYHDDDNLYYETIMLGATTIYSSDYNDMIVYYKNYRGQWGDGINENSNKELNLPENFYIDHVNGVCIKSEGCIVAGTIRYAYFRYTNFEGEIVNDTVSFINGSTVAQPEAPVRLGSEFVCWTEYEEGTNPEDRDCYEFDEPTTSGAIFEAKFNKVSYTIKYDLNGGTVDGTEIADQTCDFDSILSTNECNLNNATPNKNGYVFLGWSTTNDLEDNSVVVTDANLKDALVNATGATVTLHAIWKPAEYTITYDLNGGDEFTGYVAARYTILDNITLTTPTRTGYTFDGWYENGTTKVTSINGRTGDITLTAHWNEVSVTITYKDANNQSIAGFNDLSCKYEGCTISKSTPTDANNFAFKYWLGSDGNYYKSGAVIKGITSNLTLKAIFENSASYKITFDTNGGDSLASNVISEYVSSIGANLPVPTRADYTFTGWVKNGDTTGTKYFEIEKNTTGNLALTATWTKNTYSYGVFVDDSKSILRGTANYNDSITLPSVDDAKNENNDKFYTLSKWYEVNSGRLFNPGASVTIDSNKVFIPIWNISSTYTAVFDNNDGTNTKTTRTYNYGNEDSIVIPADPTRDGYAFAGWEVTGGDASINTTTNKVEITDNKYGNLYFKASWIKTRYNINYDLDGGSASNPSTYETSSSSVTLTAPTKEHYSFDYWSVVSGNATVSGNTLNITGTGDINLKANWTAEAYTISFNGGSASTSITCYYNSPCAINESSLITDESQDGKYLLYWKNGDGTAIYRDGTSVKFYENMSLEPVWLGAGRYEVSYDLDGGTITGSYSTSAEYGTTIVLPTTVVKDGYSFVGWVEGDNCSSATYITEFSGISSNKNVKACYNANDVQVIYYSSSDNSNTDLEYAISDDDKIAYGSFGYVVRDYDDSDLDETFAYWTSSDGYTYAQGDYLLVSSYSSNIELRPHFINDVTKNEKIHTISYNFNGGSAAAELTAKYVEGDTFNFGSVTKEGYNFAGWYTDSTFTTQVSNVSEVSGDVTLYARWTESTVYTLTYYSATSYFGNTTQSVVDGDSATISSPPWTTINFLYWTADGYKYSIGESITPTKNYDFYAVYNSATYASYNHTITYNNVDSTLASKFVSDYTTDYSAFVLPTLTSGSYTFAGWIDGSDNYNSWLAGGAVTPITSVAGQTADLDLYPAWITSFGAPYSELITDLY